MVSVCWCCLSKHERVSYTHTCKHTYTLREAQQEGGLCLPLNPLYFVEPWNHLEAQTLRGITALLSSHTYSAGSFDRAAAHLITHHENKSHRLHLLRSPEIITVPQKRQIKVACILHMLLRQSQQNLQESLCVNHVNGREATWSLAGAF